MTKEVLINIKGMQFLGYEDDPEEPIELMTSGEYYFRNGAHFIKYEEVFEEMDGSTSNILKIKQNVIELRKKGVANVHMVFEKDKKNITFYDTPFGQIQMGVSTTDIKTRIEEDKMFVCIEYTLDMNDSYVADCTLELTVNSKPNLPLGGQQR